MGLGRRGNQPWSNAMKAQGHKCKRCDSPFSLSVRPKQKKKWLVDGVAYCGTCIYEVQGA